MATMRLVVTAIAMALGMFAQPSLAAVNCTLDHPDRDTKRLFPEATNYKVREMIPFRHGAKNLFQVIARELNADLDKEYDTADTPYTFYAIYKGSEQIGLILGINARMVDGPVQLFVGYERKGNICDVYVQKISSSEASRFRSKYYRQQYKAFSVNRLPEEADIKPPLRSPSNAVIRDHHSFLRAVRLNILLVRELYNKFSEGGSASSR